MFSTWFRAQAPTRRTALAVLVLPALLAPLACTAILGDFTVSSSSGPATDSGNVDSQAGDGPTDSTHFTDVVQVAAGRDHTCALRSTGEVYCWGENALGQLGNSGNSSPTPVRVANLTKIRAIAAGNNHTCALDGNVTSGGKVYCWGSNSQGQLAFDATQDHSSIPQTLANPTDLVAITAGSDYTCGFDSSGAVFCWGSNSLAQLGVAADSTKHTDPVTPTLPNGVQEISAGSEITCVIASGSPAPTIACWGSSNHAEIPVTADGGAEAPPTTVAFGGAGAAHVASGLTHVCGTDTGGAAYCWGSNDYGESAKAGSTGAGVTVPPNLVPGISGVAAIGAGENYSCALTVAKYGMSCWGSNNYGALGNGQPTTGNLPQATPSDVAALSGVGVISIGFRHACAVVKPAPSPGQADTASGALWCWGDNSKGQLGDGTTGNQKSTPVQVLKPAN